MYKNKYCKIVSKHRETLIKNATKYEERLKQILNSNGIEYKFQHIIKIDDGENFKEYIVDFFIPSKNVVIEVDGSQHNQPKHIEKDKIRKWNLEKLGYKMLVLRNDQLRGKKGKEIIETLDRKIKNYLPSIYYKPSGKEKNQTFLKVKPQPKKKEKLEIPSISLKNL